MKLTYVEVVTLPLAFLFIKLTFFLLYMKLFEPLKRMRIAIWIGGTLSTVFYTVIVILTFYFSTPRPGETFATHVTTSLQAKEQLLSVPFAAISLFFDFYVLILPIVGVWQLQMSNRRKFAVALVFMTGAM